MYDEWKKYPAERSEWTMDLARQKIESYNNVYQGIVIDEGLVLGKVGRGASGDWRWENLVKKSIPSFKDKRVLDVGCNAGAYCIGVCREGAREVVGIENHPEYFDQALFIKSFFEWKEKKKYPIEYIHEDILTVLDRSEIGKFDVVILGNIIYHHFEGNELNFLEKIKRLNPEVVIVTGNIRAEGGTVKELQLLMKDVGLLGVSVVNHSHNSTPVLRGFWSIPQFKYKIIEVDPGSLWVGNRQIFDSPFIDFLQRQQHREMSLVEIEGTSLWEYSIVQAVRIFIKKSTTNNITVDDCRKAAKKYCVSFVKMRDVLERIPYLSGEYSYSYIPVFRDGKKIRIFNGIHRASVLFFLGQRKIKVCLLDYSELDKWRYYAATNLFGMALRAIDESE